MAVSADDLQQGGLARPVRPNHEPVLPRLDTPVNAGQRPHTVVEDADVLQKDDRGGHSGESARARTSGRICAMLCRPRTAAVIAAMFLVLAGCGSSGDKKTTATTSATTPAPTVTAGTSPTTGPTAPLADA